MGFLEEKKDSNGWISHPFIMRWRVSRLWKSQSNDMSFIDKHAHFETESWAVEKPYPEENVKGVCCVLNRDESFFAVPAYGNSEKSKHSVLIW